MTEQSSGNGGGRERKGADSFEIKVGLAEMLKGGVIMDVTTPDQAKVAEEAGAVAVMALERVPAVILKEGGVAGMCSFEVIEGKDHFRLSDGGVLLLWGPVSSTEPEVTNFGGTG